MVILKALEWEEGPSQPLPMQGLWLSECKMISPPFVVEGVCVLGTETSIHVEGHTEHWPSLA